MKDMYINWLGLSRTNTNHYFRGLPTPIVIDDIQRNYTVYINADYIAKRQLENIEAPNIREFAREVRSQMLKRRVTQRHTTQPIQHITPRKLKTSTDNYITYIYNMGNDHIPSTT